MYLISMYFDDKTNKQLQYYINKCNQVIQTSYDIPIHMTLTSFYASESEAIKVFDTLDNMSSFTVDIVSFGFLPHALYLQVATNTKLFNVYSTVSKATVSYKKNSYYKEDVFFPHITISKHINNKDKEILLKTIQDEFIPCKATIKKIALSKSNPYQDIVIKQL